MTNPNSSTGLDAMEAQHIYHAIEALRNELIARDDARKESIDGILDHLKTLNGRTRRSEDAIAGLPCEARMRETDAIVDTLKSISARTNAAESSIARLNLVVFSVGGVIGTAAVALGFKFIGG